MRESPPPSWGPYGGSVLHADITANLTAKGGPILHADWTKRLRRRSRGRAGTGVVRACVGDRRSRGILQSSGRGVGVSLLVCYWEDITMTELRTRMIQDMKLAGHLQGTQDAYIRVVRQLAGHFRISPDQLTERQVRDYLMHWA